MSKAVLILEMPDRCGHCRLSAMVKYYAMCTVTGLECAENGRPEWCPLKEMPPEAVPDNSDMPIMWNVGWNACLDELEGNNDK